MKKLNIPEGYQQVMPYLFVDDAAAFIEFTKKVFDAEEKQKHMRDENFIMHAEISIGGSVIMLADATKTNAKGAISMFIYVDDCDAVHKNALGNGATSVNEPGDQDYGRSAGILDPFGNTWWLTAVV